jgi:hypothetical protein
MSRFGQTGIVIAKCDRSVDPYVHIDRTRQEVYEHLLRLEALELEVQGIKNTNVTRWTETGIWDVFQARLNRRAIRLGSKLMHWVVGLIGIGVTGLLGLLFKLAWKGLHT